MYLVIFLSLLSLGLTFISQSPMLFGVALFLVGSLTLFRAHRFKSIEGEFARVQKLLARSGVDRPGQRCEEQVKSLLWQVNSSEQVGSNLNELNAQIQDVLKSIRQHGNQELEQLAELTLTLTRGSRVALCLFGAESAKAFGIPAKLADREDIPLRLGELSKQLTAYSAPLDAQVYDVDDRDSSIFFFWPNVQHILFSYAPISGESEAQKYLGIFLGYSDRVLPLPREKEIVRETVRSTARALREFSTVRDISNRADAEKKKQEKYFAHISHDIRTPLNNIQAILDLFYLEGVTEKNQQFLQVARANCRSLRDIVEELLEFTKYKDGNLHVVSEKIRISQVIDEVMSEFSLTAELKGISLGSAVNDRLGIEVDRKHFKRILMNLVSNGIKYTECGSVQVTTELDGGEVVVSVSDTGIGIPESKREKLFVPFSRIGEVKVEGIGLGLTLTKILVDSNGGSIHVESEHGHGSTFCIRFPAIEMPRLPSNLESDSLQQKDAFIKAEASMPRRLLVIDDDQDACITLSNLLEQLGFETQTLSRLSDLRGLLNFWKPDVVISDVEMPDGGIGKVIGISRFHDIPVLALTGCVEQERLEQLKEEGVQKILRKPVDPDELQSTLNELPLLRDRDPEKHLVSLQTTPARQIAR